MNFELDLQNCLDTLRKEGVILYPTDTIWGLGCDATNEHAVQKIIDLKQRDSSKSMIALVSDNAMLNKYVRNIPAQAWDIMELSDSPVTLIYDKGLGFAKNMLPADGSVAVRLVKDPFCQKLIHQFGKPIVSTSANFSGTPSPSIFADISEELKSQCNYIVTWKQNDRTTSKPSSIIRLKENGEFLILRK